MISLVNAANLAHSFRQHPLGFFYLQESVSTGQVQRIHIWLNSGPDAAANDCHQHSYDIESTVVAGRMRSNLFNFKEEKGGPDLEFAVTYKEKGSIQSPSGRRGRLSLIASFETPSGFSYWLKAGVIHRVQVIERPCITLLQTQEHHLPIFTYGHENETAFERRLCNDSEAEQIRDQLIKVAQLGRT